MKATELRIGNFCQDNVTKTTIKVVELTNECITTYVIDRSKFPLKDGWKLQPIPLTEEWLLKFGFNGECESFHMEGITIEEVSDGGKWVVYMFDEYHAVECSLAIVQHVHQLQNLYFALTNEELTL